ncbi:MAG: hypothetical protein QM770_23115 [Tepidisphaeraceae bacterium]
MTYSLNDNRRARLLLSVAATAAIGGMLGLAGCERTDASIREAQQSALIARSDPDANKAASAVATALSSATSSDPAVTAQNAAILADAQLTAAREARSSTDPNNPGLDSDEAEMNTVLVLLSQKIAVARDAGADLAAMRKRNPKPVVDQLKGRVADARGDGNKPVAFAADLTDPSGKAVKVAIPSRNDVTQKLSAVAGQIATLQDQITKLNDQLGQQQIAAADAARAADAGKTPDERLGALKKAGDARVDAAKVAEQIANAQAELAKLQTEQALLQQQQASLDEAVAALDTRVKGLEDTWNKTNADIDARSAAAGAVITGQEDSIASLSARLTAADTLATNKRAELVKTLEGVVNGYGTAVTNAQTLQTNYQTAAGDSTNPQSGALQKLLAAVNMKGYQIDQASALLELGSVHLSHARLLDRWVSVSKDLADLLGNGGVKGSAPQALSGEQSKTLAETLTSANDAYDKAVGLLDSAQGSGASPSVRQSALALKVQALYAQSRVVALAQSAGVELKSGDKALTADELLNRAKEVAKEAFDQQIPMGPLPEEFKERDAEAHRSGRPDDAGRARDADHAGRHARLPWRWREACQRACGSDEHPRNARAAEGQPCQAARPWFRRRCRRAAEPVRDSSVVLWLSGSVVPVIRIRLHHTTTQPILTRRLTLRHRFAAVRT